MGDELGWLSSNSFDPAHSGRCCQLDPAWSPDGGKIFFDSRRALDGTNSANTNLTVNIWAMNSDGSGATALTKITSSDGDSAHPTQP